MNLALANMFNKQLANQNMAMVNIQAQVMMQQHMQQGPTNFYNQPVP